MRTFSEGRLARSIACLLSGVFLWSVGFIGIAALPGSAQIVTKGESTQSVAVVTFQNRTKVLPETLGVQAADAVAGELRDRLLLDVLPKDFVGLQIRDLGMTAPLSDVEMVRLATELDVALMVTGEVRGARIINTRDGRYAEIVLAVRLFDRLARADVNGALVSVVSPTSDASEDVLIEKALQQAAFNAVQQMKARPTVTAMVLWSRGDTVFLNVGTRGGVRAGVKLVAIRGGERIGLAKVTEADAIGSYATLVEGAPLRTGDHLRAIYELPSGTRIERVGVAQEKRSRIETLAITAAVLLGLGNYASRNRMLDEGNIAAPGFKARNLANGVEMGITGYGQGATYLTWESFQGTTRSRLAGYEIYRNGSFVDFIFLQGGQETYYIDMDVGIVWLSETWTIDPATGLVSLTATTLDVWNGTDDLGEWYASHETSITACAACSEVTYNWFPSGPYPGMRYTYQVQPLLATTTTTAGLSSWVLTRNTQPSRPDQVLVSISPPDAFPWHYVFAGYDRGVYEIWDIYPNPEIRNNIATFFFYTPIGADEVIAQIARDPNSAFDPSGLYTQSVPVGSYLYEQSFQVDLAGVPGTGSTFWWRLGARNRLDTNPPEPYPSLFRNDFGWVWSYRNAFDVGLGGSRASLMHEQRAAMEALRTSRARVPRTATGERLHRAE